MLTPYTAQIGLDEKNQEVDELYKSHRQFLYYYTIR